MSGPSELLDQSLALLRAATRISGAKNSYRKDNPKEYQAVFAYLDGGTRPSGTLSKLGQGLVLEEDARRALVVQAPPVPPVRAFGNPWNSSGLANLEIGKYDRRVAYRFKALGGQLASVRCFLKQGSGYSSGDGGDIRLDLYAADSDGLPMGGSLANATVTDPTTSQFHTFSLSSSLAPGQRYFLVWSNTSPGQATNYVSLNNMDCDPPFSPRQPEVTDADLAVLYRDGTSAWVEHAKRTPIVDITYADGTWQGQTYIDFRSSSGRTALGSVIETLRPKMDLTFTRAHAFVSGSGPLTFAISGKSAVAQINGQQGWASVDLPVSLMSGSTYSLTVSAAGGVYIYPYVKGANYGFHDPFSEGSSSVNANEDWPIYLT